MDYTTFAGLTDLAPGDPITIDGSSFLVRNPAITDHYLQIGAVSHRHDAHEAIAAPTAAMTGEAVGSAGALAGGSSFALTYTLIDADGGETLAAAPLTLTTGTQIAAPSGTIVATPDYSAGIMPAGTYFYAQTLTDGAGGETPIGPSTLAYVDPGYASAQVQLSGLAANLGDATNWRLWRSDEGADWHLLAQGATDTYTDTGFDPPDNPAVPPEANSTAQTWSLSVTLPTVVQEPAIASGQAINVYLAPDTTFADPCFYAQVPTASAGATLTIATDLVYTGRPPVVATAIGGAAKINPDTDMLDFPWKRPVATVAELPTEDNEDGDARIVLATYSVYLWDAATSTWVTATGGSSGASVNVTDGSITVDAPTTLQFAGASGTTVAVSNPSAGEALVTITAPTASGGSSGGASGTISPLTSADWVAITLINGWTAVSGSTPGILKDPLGFVYLRGLIQGGGSGSAAFVLPVGYRIGEQALLATQSGGPTPGCVQIFPPSDPTYANQVLVYGNTSVVSLNTSPFLAES
jgi:hypothetical protein